MEDKNIEFIKMDEGEAEAAKSFIITQLDEYVLPYIYEKNLMFSSEKGSIYSEYLSISASASALLPSYADKSQNSESKKAELDSQLRELYIRTKNLVTRVLEEQSMGSSKKL